MNRQIVLDTETTGLSPEEGHRIVEIGCVELVNGIPTGRVYQQYVNPLRDMPIQAFKVHGLREEFLKDYPSFQHIIQDFVGFLGDGELVIHNATFDMKFINFELEMHGVSPLENLVVDTLQMAREKFPGSPATLDALCRRFEIDNSHRELHGALLDCEILAQVYLELLGGRQQGLLLGIENDESEQFQEILHKTQNRPYRHFPLSNEQKLHHKEFLEKKVKGALWLN